MPEISIIVPVYNAEQYLRACIDSILAQTFSDFELLLVDDGSPDDCLAICREYEKRDPRITVFHQENQGQAAARNLAISHARGAWFCFVDSDDLIHPQMVELLHTEAVASGAGISMCSMLEAEILPPGFMDSLDGQFAVLEVSEDMLAELYDRGEYPAWVACAKLIRRELVEGHLFCPGRVYEDNEAVCRWVCGAGKLAISDQKLYFYRNNPVSTTQKTFSLKRLDYFWALERIVRYYGELGYEKMKLRFCDLYAEAAAGYYRRLIRENNLPEAAEIMKKNAHRLFFRERLPLSKHRFEDLLDALHPGLIRLYWPLEGIRRTLREQGLGGLIKKLTQHLQRGEGI